MIEETGFYNYSLDFWENNYSGISPERISNLADMHSQIKIARLLPRAPFQALPSNPQGRALACAR
ncbi:hypothetical protein, partial [Desulfonatronospira sp. MSAO_Bac3]|uniref:hypothetical protein n=1 Tax=Desulfonatronospira sp. MSAO_Bac3 TaxID=2293857 RepID=UPI002579D977